MAYSTYEGMSMPVAEHNLPVYVTGVDGEQWRYDANCPQHQSFGYAHAPEPWTSTSPGFFGGLSVRDTGVHEHRVPSSSAFLPRADPGPASRQSLHVMTNIPPDNSGMWGSGGSGAPLVQSPSSYSQPSPTHHYGIHPIPRRKLVKVTFDEVNYTLVDLTRHRDAESARKNIISRVPPTVGPFSRFDIFRTHPSREEAALNDEELMLDIENFGDDRGSLKLLVRAADRHSDSHLPSYVRAATTPSLPNHSYPIGFPSANLPIPSHSSRVGSGEWYGPNTPTPDTRVYPHTPSRSPGGYPPTSISMPMPMPAPTPVHQSAEQGATLFPRPDHSFGHGSMPAFPPLTPNNSWAQPFAGQSNFANPTQSPPQFDNLAEAQRSQHASNYYRTESPTGSLGDSEGRGSRDSTVRVDTRPGSVVIGGTMTTDEVLSHLYERGCKNVTSKLNEAMISRDPVARGGGGDVYSGKLYSGRCVALKCVRLAIGNEDRSKLKKTAHELYVWSKCKHPNVLELIGVTRCRGQVAMVSPWIDNGDLRTFLRLNPEADRHDLCVQMAVGVAYLHGQTIVHGDIKGANILISQDRVVKITDFGTSALKHYTLEFAATRTKPGLSIRWAAPEILEENSDNSYEADVYALAMTILEAITGDVPYANISKDCVVIRKITQGKLPARPEARIPSGDYYGDMLWSLLSGCWAYEHWKRPSAAYLHHQLKTTVF